MSNLTGMGFEQPEWQPSSSTSSFSDNIFKRKFRWKFSIPSICADTVDTLPPSKSARPNLTFKTMEAQHLNETIYYPAKPEWKPITLQLYDIVKYDNNTPPKPYANRIFQWIRRAYDPEPMNANSTITGCTNITKNNTNCGAWHPSLGDMNNQGCMPGLKVGYATLELYDGCGCVLERWRLEHVWPESVDWGDLEYGSSEIVMCEITLRYDRAFIDCLTPTPWCSTPVITCTPIEMIGCTFQSPSNITMPIKNTSGSYCQNQATPDVPVSVPLGNIVQRSEITAPIAQAAEPPKTKRKFLVRK